MHELSLAIEIAQIVDHAVAQNGLTVVERLNLTVGELASVEKPALDFALASVLAGTAAENAQIVYIDEAGEGVCRQCGEHVLVHQFYEPCPLCQQLGVEVVRGRALKVKAIEGY